MSPDLAAAAAVAAIMTAGAVTGYVWALWCPPRHARRSRRGGAVRGRGVRYWTVRARLAAPRGWLRWRRRHPELDPEARAHLRSTGGLERIRARIRGR